jgi:hypothetical protein
MRKVNKEETKREGKEKTHLLEHVVERFEGRKHRFNVVITVEETGSLLESLMPQLVPENSDSNELLTDENGLFDERSAVVSHLVHDLKSSASTSFAGVLGGDGERVDERLRVRLTDVGKNSLDELANALFRSVDAGDELGEGKRSASSLRG